MNILVALIGVLLLVLIAYIGAGVGGLYNLFGVYIPYVAFVVFVVGIVYRVIKWACSPVPFRIPTSCGQQKSLPWIKDSKLENPSNLLGVLGRMALEVFLFRSLFRNTKTELKDNRLIFSGDKWLWAAGLLFHYSFLVIILRHFRFFTEPVAPFVPILQDLDGFFELNIPVFYLSDAAILAAVTYLFLRRVVIPQVKYISLPADYFPLLLILGIAGSGVLMRHFYKVDLVGVKELAMGLITFHPAVPEGIGTIFYVHLFLVCALIAYFPFSKLLHMPGIFMSPTRNLANNNRMVRHINPWNPQVKVHTYEEWEEEFHDLLKGAGIPLDKEQQ